MHSDSVLKKVVLNVMPRTCVSKQTFIYHAAVNHYKNVQTITMLSCRQKLLSTSTNVSVAPFSENTINFFTLQMGVFGCLGT